MALSDDQVEACAYQYAGLLMLNPQARGDVVGCGNHKDTGFHEKLASVLNKYVEGLPELDTADAVRVCAYASTQGSEFRTVVNNVAPGSTAQLVPYIDGMHVQST